TVYGNPTTTFALLHQLRTQIIRINLIWAGAPHGVASDRRPAHPQDPADPAYDWTLYDRAVRYAAQNGIQVLFTILFTPKWANGGAARNVPPSNYNDLRNFAYAAAERYSGRYIPVDETGETALPAVKKWLAWNEPNNPIWLKQSSGGRFVSPKEYAKICTAIYPGVHNTNFGGEQVACGATGPRGNNQAKPGALPVAGVCDRAPHAADRADDLVHAQGRHEHRHGLAVGATDGGRKEEAGVQRVSESAPLEPAKSRSASRMLASALVGRRLATWPRMRSFKGAQCLAGGIRRRACPLGPCLGEAYVCRVRVSPALSRAR